MPRRQKPARLWQRTDDGAWIILDKGKHVRTGFGDGEREQAEEALAEYLTNRNRSTAGPTRADRITCGEILAAYVEDVGDEVRAPDRLIYSVQALAPFWGDVTADAVTRASCEQYVQFRKAGAGSARKAGSGTARRELGVLQTALNHAYREKRLVHPVLVTLPQAANPKERWLTRTEIARLLRSSPPHLRRFIILSVYTGRRKQAVLGLRWSPSSDSGWVDLRSGIIHFLGQQQTESKKRKGAIRMSPRLHAHLRRWYDPSASHVIMYRGRPIKDVKTGWRPACERAGLAEVTRHTLKHTAVTLAFQSGMTIEDAEDYFATSAATLQRVYRKHSPHHQHRAASVMQRLGR